MKLDAFSSTIEAIYAAAANPSGWDTALRAIEDLTGSVGAVIDFVPRSRASAPMTMAGRFTLEQCAEFASDYQGICRRLAYGLAHPDIAIHYDAMVLSEAEMDHDPVYAWLARHDLRYYIGGRLPDSERYMIYASLQRSSGQGHVQADDIRLFELVSRHLGKAITLADRLGTLQTHQRFSQDYLDRLPQALFLLDGEGYLLFANRAADAMLSQGCALACPRGRLVARHPASRPALDRLIASAIHPEASKGGGWIRLAREDDAPPLAAFVTHLAADGDAFSGNRPSVLVAVAEPSRNPALEPQALCELYGLTAAEARIACALADAGRDTTPEKALGIAPETLKAHLKSIFRKLDVHRRQDVVQVVTGLAGVAGSTPNGG